MSPKERKASPVAAWRRAEAGRYRSADGRFEIEGDSPGRWYVRDTEERDELGLERTIGPFATLDEAKADASSRRERPPETSPLAARLGGAGTGAGPRTEGKDRRSQRGAVVAPGTAGPSTSAGGAGGTEVRPTKGRPTAGGQQGVRADAGSRNRPEPRPRWLDRLEAERPEVARVARRRIAALGRLGIDDAEALVRRDIEADEPVIAERLLARSIGRAVAAALGDAPTEEATSAGVAGRVLAATLEQVTGRERDADAGADLPGWRLVERDPEDPARDRRIRLGGQDVRHEASGD